MPAPVNVKLAHPTIPVSTWNTEATEWIKLNNQVSGNQDFFPLTIKAAYVIGVIHNLCSSVSYLLKAPDARDVTYLPAYAVFASGVDILGRSIVGNPSPTAGATDNLRAGFRWLVSSAHSQVPDSHVLISTATHSYEIQELVYLRHFAAHGQATSPLQFTMVDFELLAGMPPLLANGLERYWSLLQIDEDACNRLASANVIALRSQPVLRSWVLFERDASGRYHSVEEIFNRFNWTV